MSVLIGHASISETGGVNGAKGDSTGKEVYTRTWYSKPWDFMAIHPDATVREKHAKAVEQACANDNIGYGQSDRNTLYTLAKAVSFNLSKVGKCNCDCSSLQNVAAVASGAPGVTYGSNGWTTYTMKAALLAAGYKIITDSVYLKSEAYCVRGAIYVNISSHTVCGLTNGSKASQTLAKAGISGTVNGSAGGDVSYTVVSGDTLTAIASRYGTTYKVLAEYNGITDPNKITVGHIIKIPSSAAGVSGKPTYTVGQTYALQVDHLTVRTGAGTNYTAKTYSQLTTNAKQNAYSDGTLKKGTKVSCLAVRNVGSDIWIQIPSGWVAAYYSGSIYIA